jgi:hypothetical protein|nr:MAG TPA: hypothetical protein [Caudoviricetes sp.]
MNKIMNYLKLQKIIRKEFYKRRLKEIKNIIKKIKNKNMNLTELKDTFQRERKFERTFKKSMKEIILNNIITL